MTDGERRTATKEEVQTAVEALDADELLALRHIAIRMALGSSYLDPQDLVHDAIESALVLRRRWNQEHPFRKFLCGAMKSLACNDRRSLRTRRERLAAGLVDTGEPDNDSVLNEADAAAQTLRKHAELAEEQAQERRQQYTDAVFELFADDPDITMMLMAMEDGFRGEAIAQQCDMTSTKYETARKRMRRRLASAFPKRGS